ncbi:hypothetical protein GCM10022243_33900 [Saccharothrix violaceirubra]|uniref:Bacteriophage T5 Orf172 DNA-binding domain-containing protein n=1 Tax=Saccharothrix violaceirubra TaxID=413306 RepID=A0A7W7T4K1_9PSEU|nr:DUF4041 domain-containing protein [Saccharothrix violaceirubra]MBB4966444.1 hypothetical protein [Saccharothrix violaceirubra]
MFNRDSAEAAALHQRLAGAEATVNELRAWVGHLRGTDAAVLEGELRALRSAVERTKGEVAALAAEKRRAEAEAAALRALVVETRETALLQEVGIYEYAHPLQDALAYKDALAALKQRIDAMAKGGQAVTCQVDWTVNGSRKDGDKLGRDMAKLMLRAYNAEADNAVRTVKPHTREKVKTRLTTTRDTIGRLGALMRVTVSADYHRLRLHEIDLTTDHLVKVESEREAAREERARLREEAKAAKEIERERARLAKERAHRASVVARLEAKGDTEALAQARLELAAVDDAISGVDERAANVRMGYVYVISNIGAFGPDVVKIGMTRRLDPMDRVRELGDASVPFRFDTHALFFSKDAVALETALHRRLAHRRVNVVNPRREFFRATPAEVRALLGELDHDAVLEYTETPEAAEWRASGAHLPADPDADGDLSDDGGE